MDGTLLRDGDRAPVLRPLPKGSRAGRRLVVRLVVATPPAIERARPRERRTLAVAVGIHHNLVG